METHQQNFPYNEIFKVGLDARPCFQHPRVEQEHELLVVVAAYVHVRDS